MDYKKMIDYHLSHQSELTIAAIRVPMEEASRFGILGVDDQLRIHSFIEKPKEPPSNLVNMGVYLFDTALLNEALWEDHMRADSSHDFGKDILPRLVAQDKRVLAYPFEGYWVDVGTVESYWKAHMDLLASPPPIDLNDRSWIVHTRTEERPPVWIESGSTILDSMVTDGCEVSSGARVERSVLGPGVRVRPGAVVRESVVLTDAVIEAGAVVEHAIIDKKAYIGENARVGAVRPEPSITMLGKHSRVSPGMVVEHGVIIGPDVVESDFSDTTVREGAYLQTKREPFEV